MSRDPRKWVRDFLNFLVVGRSEVWKFQLVLIRVGPFFNMFGPGPRWSRLSKIAPVVVRILDYKIGNWNGDRKRSSSKLKVNDPKIILIICEEYTILRLKANDLSILRILGCDFWRTGIFCGSRSQLGQFRIKIGLTWITTFWVCVNSDLIVYFAPWWSYSFGCSVSEDNILPNLRSYIFAVWS